MAIDDPVQRLAAAAPSTLHKLPVAVARGNDGRDAQSVWTQQNAVNAAAFLAAVSTDGKDISPKFEDLLATPDKPPVIELPAESRGGFSLRPHGLSD